MVDIAGERDRTGVWSGFPQESINIFLRHGWTATQVNTLHRDLCGNSLSAARASGSVRLWLKHPPGILHPRVTPNLVRRVHATYGRRAAPVLNAYCAGASPRFVATLTAHTRHPVTALDWDFETRAWLLAQSAGLGERAATGWAATGWLSSRHGTNGAFTVDTAKVQARIRRWVRHLGPGAYLWALAGYTLPEAKKVRAKGRRLRAARVSNQQLRVMVALNGPTLPVGV